MAQYNQPAPGAPGAAAGVPVVVPKKGFMGWLNKRMPVNEFLASQLTEYYAPKNFNIWYFFGSLALVVLVMQLLTGIFLTMFYKPGELTSFDSVEFIMREVSNGWLIRYLHSTGASAFSSSSTCTCLGRFCTGRISRRASCCGCSACSCTWPSWPRRSWDTYSLGATCPSGARR